MMKTLGATFDGKVFLPDVPLNLMPNTKVNIIVEIPETENSEPVSFLRTARNIKLTGPEDWSENLA